MTDGIGDDLVVPRRAEKISWREYERGILTENGLALNVSAGFIFKTCDGEHDLAQIAAAYQIRFGVDAECARSDVRQAVNELLALRLVVLDHAS